MNIRHLMLVCIVLTLLGGIVSGENNTVSNTTNTTNQSTPLGIPTISPTEQLMNRAFEARVFALEHGKEAALSEFSNPSSTFCTDGMYICAYGSDGILLADVTRNSEVGSRFIADDHDAGQVRQMRDLATTGGGLYSDTKTGASYYVLDVDGSWWICAAFTQ